MPTGEVDSCNSCLLPYNNKERTPKVCWQCKEQRELVYNNYQSQILKCYHTYCKACLEQFMFKDNMITCLSCGVVTPAKR